jgi:integrase
MPKAKVPQGSLVIRVSVTDQPFYEAKWRDSARRQRKRRLGPAWLDPNGEGGYRRRRGRVQDGFLNERAAHVAMAKVIAREEEDLRERPEAREVTFGQVADAWLVHLARTGGAKPSTLSDYRYMLARPKAVKGRKNAARIMRAFDSTPAAEARSRDIEAFLTSLDKTSCSARTINKHRQVLHAIFVFAQEQFGLRDNPVALVKKRREDPPGRLEYYSPEEVAALARAATEGLAREEGRPTQLDVQDGALFIVAAYTGLRMGELLALRWRDIDVGDGRLTVERALSAGEVSTPKSNAIRTLPLADKAAAALARLEQRGTFTDADDYVFCGAAGEVLDRSALRKRFKAAQRAEKLRPLRFHDLRHTFGSLAVRELDSVNVQAILGHSKLSTTERYLHAKPRHDDVAKLNRAFAGDIAAAAEEAPGPAPRT